LPVESSRAVARTRAWSRLTREPLLHFALLGAAIFVLAHHVEQVRQQTQSRIVVDQPLRDRLSSLYRTQFGSAPTAAQLEVIVEDYIDDEVEYREALRLGLADDDEIIRRRLIQKLEFLQRDAVAGTNPTPAELRAYYDAHPALFVASERVSFAHAFFSADHGGDGWALARAREARAQWLARGEAPQGDTFPLEVEYASLTRAEIARVFGGGEFAAATFQSAPDEWTGPVRSGFGWHLVRVTSRESAKVLPFEQVLPDVRAAWLHDSTAQARRQALDRLRSGYQIESRDATP
jgi:hypothetical protein